MPGWRRPASRHDAAHGPRQQPCIPSAHLAEMHSSPSSTGQTALNISLLSLQCCSTLLSESSLLKKETEPVPCLHPSCWFLPVSGVLQTAAPTTPKAALLPCPSCEQLCRALAGVWLTSSGDISASQCRGKWRSGLGCPGRWWWQCGVSEAAWLSAAHSFPGEEYPPHCSADPSCMVTVTGTSVTAPVPSFLSCLLTPISLQSVAHSFFGFLHLPSLHISPILFLSFVNNAWQCSVLP